MLRSGRQNEGRLTMRLKTIGFAGAALLAVGSPALAGQGFYVGAEVGWSFPNDVKWSLPDLPGTNRGAIDQDSAVIWGGSIGYKLPLGLRFEVEGTRVKYGSDFMSLNNIRFPGSGDISQTVVLGNLIY